MPKRSPETAYIVASAHDGRGIADVEGKKVFVAGALEGEEVLFQRRKRRRKYDEAELLEVIQSSKDRIKPRCEVYGRCGGCSLQHLTVSAQRQLKFQTLKDNIQRIGKTSPHKWLDTIHSHKDSGSWNYRRRARLGVKDVKGKNRVLVGFRERYAPFVTDMHQCDILGIPINSMIVSLSELVSSLSLRSKTPQIEVSIAENKVELIFRILESPTNDDIDILKRFSKENNLRIALQSGGPSTIQLLDTGSEEQALNYRHDDHDIVLEFISSDFIQINSEVNKLMVSKAIELLCINKSDTVTDLFCGIGNFSLPLSRYAKNVIGVELQEDFIKRAKCNAKLNNINNVEFFTGDLFKSDNNWSNLKCNKLLLDPARSGALEVVSNIELFNAKKIVYVSCHPGTLARDTDILVNEKKYTLDTAGIIDMFPHTSHVESIALFSK